MIAFRSRLLNLMLSGLLLMAAVPPFELKHSHSDGHVAHVHHGHDVEVVSANRHVHHHSEEHHEGHHHAHENLQAHVDVDDSRLHDQEAARQESYAGRHSEEILASERQSSHSPETGTELPLDPDDWHVHLTWLGWLTGNDWSAGSPPDLRMSQHVREGSLLCSGDASVTLRDPVIRMYAIWLHGPPEWRRPATDIFRFSPERWWSDSPPLCDVSRHERSGVLLI